MIPSSCGITELAANSNPNVASAASERSRLKRNDGCSVRGTFQMLFIASCAAWAAAIPAHNAPAMPTTRASTLPVSAWEFSPSCGPTTGNWASAESRISAAVSGLFCRTKPRIVVIASSAGNTEKKP